MVAKTTRRHVQQPDHLKICTSNGGGGAGSDTKANLDGLALIQRGNEYFFSDCYLEATGYYYQAAMLLKASKEKHRVERSKAWSNVAECHLRLRNWQAAQDAATNALGADPTNTKALFRRAKARFELGDYKGAAKDADAVGTQDAMDVAALCRELAEAATMREETTNVGGEERDDARRPYDSSRLGGGEEGIRDQSPPAMVMDERELWFRRIIDSYRLRIDDEYTQTGAADASCLYGIRAKGGHLPPLNHFRSYVQRALKKRLLPLWFTASDMEKLGQMATSDNFSNINIAGVPEEIEDYYTELGFVNELELLRDLALYIEGPIGMPWDDSKPLPSPPPRVIPEPGPSPSWVRRYEERPLPNIYELSEKLSGSQVIGSSQQQAQIRHHPSKTFGGRSPRPLQSFGVSTPRGNSGGQYEQGYPNPTTRVSPHQPPRQHHSFSAGDERDDNHRTKPYHHHSQDVDHGPSTPNNRYGRSSRPPYAPVNIVEKTSSGELAYQQQQQQQQQQPDEIRRRGSRLKEQQHQQRQPPPPTRSQRVYRQNSNNHTYIKKSHSNGKRESNQQEHLMVPNIWGQMVSRSHSNFEAGYLGEQDKASGPSACPISDDSESTYSTDMEQCSFGPQLPYRMPVPILPGRPVDSFARPEASGNNNKNRSRNLNRNNSNGNGKINKAKNNPWYGGNNNNNNNNNNTNRNDDMADVHREFYSQEETSTAQSVRHGLRDMRDEVFSDLTDLSP